MPLARRLPKFGFVNRFRRSFQVVNLRDLARFEKGTLVDHGLLAEARLVARPDRPVKILAEGDVATALVLRVDAASKAAREKIEAVGGRVEILAAANRVELEGQGS